MRYYTLIIDKDNKIIRIADTFEKNDDEIEITKEEYQQALMFKKFNPTTREFSEPIEIAPKKPDLHEENALLKEKVAMHEELIFELAMIVYA